MHTNNNALIHVYDGQAKRTNASMELWLLTEQQYIVKIKQHLLNLKRAHNREAWITAAMAIDP